jgi:predicted chitinase
MANSNGILTALLLCGLLGLVGQGIRATLGLKNAAALQSGKPDQQSSFDAAYLGVSLMVGFIAGVLAGLGLGVETLNAAGPINPKILLGIIVAGYAGTDFIENAFARIIPGLASSPAAGPNPPLTVATNAADIQALITNVNTLSNTVSALSNVLPRPGPLVPAIAADAPAPLVNLAPAFNIVAPAVKSAIWVPALAAAFAKFDLNSNRRMAAAIGQFLVEAGSAFQETVENLNYTHADRIAEVFPHAFPTAADAAPYVGKPEALANVVYANRLGNGNEASGDGFRFRGRGLIQLTGRNEYAEFGIAVGMTPEQVSAYCETSEGAAMSGCWYLSSRGCLVLADTWQLSKITRAVNGAGMLGNSQRIAYANAMLKALGG